MHTAHVVVFATAMIKLGLAQIPGPGCYSVTGGLVYKGGVVETSNKKAMECCAHCCRQPGPGAAHVWTWMGKSSWDGPGTCLCQDRHKISGTVKSQGITQAGVCPNHPGDLPWVPANLNTKKWVTTGDTRTLTQHPKKQVDYECTYPNDATTIADIKRLAKAAADNGAYTEVKCDTCEDSGVDGSTGYFCVNPETYAKTGNFSVRNEPYQVNYCSEVNKFEKPRVDVYQLGVENGTYFTGGVKACSPQQPAQTCVSESTRFKHCYCDMNTCKDKHGTPDCCRWVGNETISALFTYYTLNDVFNGSVVLPVE